MMNIEQITNRLAQMPDQALQQYAMMNKEDPYIMALALSESRRRKQMRTAAAPQQQAQPKVADQALMEMGVDALPTEEMNFAGGGIVAFADGGDVEHYQVGGSTAMVDRILRKPPIARTAEENALLAQAGYTVQSRSLGPDSGVAGANTFLQGIGPQIRNYFTAGASRLSDEELAAQPSVGGAQNERILRGLGISPSPMPAAAPASAPVVDTGDETKRLAARYKAPLPPKENRGLGGTPEAKAMRGSAAPAAGAPSVQGAKDLAGQFYDTEAQKAAIDKYLAEQKADVVAARARREEGKPTGKAYSKYEEMLQGEEGRAGKERDEATGVAIFKAGLAMMGGTSPRAFENISKGALTGLDEYTSAMKDMKKAAKERQKAFADIENARRAEAREDWKAAQAFEDKAEARMDKAREIGVKGIMDVTGKSADIAASIYKTGVEQQGMNTRTKMQVDAMRDRGGNTGEKQTLNELKALQTSLKDQLKDPRMLGPKGDPLRAQLAQVNGAIANMAGLGTMAGAPGVTSPGGIPTDVQALLNKYGGK